MFRRDFISVLLTLAVWIVFGGVSLAGSLDKVQFIKISPQDAKAVIKGTDGKLQVIKPGDIVDGATVKEIAPGRIVLEEKTQKGLDTIIVRLGNGNARIERLRKQPENTPMLAVPQKSIK